STRAFNSQSVPGKLVVVGVGNIVFELGTAFGNSGSAVTILDGASHILGRFVTQMTQPVQKGMKVRGADIVTAAV
ncbi:FAD-dependent oxidoreductase, partial [Staphylococcus aureus]